MPLRKRFASRTPAPRSRRPPAPRRPASCVTRTVRLAECMAAGDQRDGLFIVHRHAAERFTDIVRRGGRIRLAIGALPGSRRSAPSALRPGPAQARARRSSAYPPSTCSPFPNSHPNPAPKRPRGRPPNPKVLKPMVSSATFPGRIIKSAHEILLAVFLLDRPQQPPRLVQVDVVRPAVERSKALLAAPPPPRPSAIR